MVVCIGPETHPVMQKVCAAAKNKRRTRAAYSDRQELGE
jgi:hypothetical protein